MLLLSVCSFMAVARKVLPSDTISDVLASFGIPLESHYVTTEDGYILNMHRLAGHSGKPVMFFQHGFLGSSATWLANDQASPAVYFWNRGYDVWLGNNRGNIYSRNHTSLDAEKDKEFWDFSYSTLGDCDVPAQLNYVVAMTAKANLTYVGWSQGTTQMFVNQAGNPHAKGKKCKVNRVPSINLFVALAPVVYLRHSPHLIIRTLSNLGIMKQEEKNFSLGFLKSPAAVNETVRWVCNNPVSKIRNLCEKAKKDVRHLFEGPMNDERAAANLRVLIPAGTSWKSARHYAQALRNRYFQDFDYGIFNFEVYGQTRAPFYNMTLKSSITTPTAFFFAENDAYVDKLDREHLLNDVENNPNIVFHKVYENFDHDTWVLANKEAQVYLKDIERLVEKYNPGSHYENDKSWRENSESLCENVKSSKVNTESSNENLESFCKNVEGGNESIESVYENFRSLYENVQSLNESIESLFENLESLSENPESPDESIESLYQNAGGSKSIESVYENIRSLYEDVGSLHEKVESLYESIESLHENAESPDENVESRGGKKSQQKREEPEQEH